MSYHLFSFLAVVLTCLLVAERLLLIYLWWHLENIIALCFVGLEGLDLSHLEVKIGENKNFFFLEMTELFWNDQIFMRHASFEGYCVLIASKLFGYFFAEGSAGETLPVHS